MDRRTLLKDVGISSAVLMAGCTGISNDDFRGPNVSTDMSIQTTPGGAPRTSSLDDVTTGEPVETRFWVTIPYSQQPTDAVFMAIDGRDPIPMERVGALNYQTTVSIPTGTPVQYRYFRDGPAASSAPYETHVTSTDQSVYDAVVEWSDSSFTPSFPPGFNVGILMMDTWGRNYNFGWFETTRNHIDTAFERVAAIGSDMVRVTDFHMAVWDDGEFSIDNTAYHIEGETFQNDNRDEVMTEADLRRLAQAAHARGMEIGWRTSFHFWDIGKYVGSLNVSEEVEADFRELQKPKSAAWVRDFLGKFGDLLVERAKLLDEVGFDEIHLTPGYMTPSYQPNEALADELWLNIIQDVRAVFDGKLSYEGNAWGFLDGRDDEEWWATQTRYHSVDRVYISIYQLPDEFTVAEPTFEDIRTGLTAYLDAIERGNESHRATLALEVRFASFENAINHTHIEFNDFVNPDLQALDRDWQHQADCYEALFQTLEGPSGFQKVDFVGYWWDNAMDPDTARPLIGKSPSPRNKPAEAVFEKWATARA